MTFDEIAKLEILGSELASVTFVQDYVQFGFDGPTLTLEGDLILVDSGAVPTPNQLVALIGQSLLQADYSDDTLTLTFGNLVAVKALFGTSPEIGNYRSDAYEFIFN